MVDISTLKIIALALTGGILPALVWLWFWLHEDKRHPEPRLALLVTFIAGMAAVIVVLPLEQLTYKWFGHSTTLLFVVWAALEETIKLIAAYIFALSRSYCDEPIDPVIYLLTTALGFAALENSLFILQPILQTNLLEGIATGDLRFMGATLLHTLASATIGVFIAFSFYRSKRERVLYLVLGLLLAIALHAGFNLSIMLHSGNSFLVFTLVWVAISLLILLFEQIKRHYSFDYYVRKK